MPNQLAILTNHMQDCDLDGPLKNIENPVVVWRNGEFEVVAKPKKNETVYPTEFKRLKHLTQEDVAALEAEVIFPITEEEVVAVEPSTEE